MIQIDAAELARSVREQKALPLSELEAERLARAIETSGDDEAFLASTLSMVRSVLDRLPPSPCIVESASPGVEGIDASNHREVNQKEPT